MNRFVLLLITLVFHIQTLQLSTIDTSLYHNSTQLESQIDKIEPVDNKTLIKKRQCSKEGAIYKIVEIGNRNLSLSAVITCNIHARQLISSETCLAFIKELTEGTGWRQTRLRESINFRIFYMGNQMRDQVIKGQFCIRTDKNNVDINRNFPTGYLGQDKGQQTNPGPKPLSQPFSQCIQEEVTSWKPDIFLDVHTGQFSIYYTTSDKLGAEMYEIQQSKVLNSVVEKVCMNCRLRNDDGLEGVMYVDMKVRKQIKWSNLFQIYGGFNKNINLLDSCFTIFNPKSKKSLDYYKRRGKNMLVQYFVSILEVQNQTK